MAVGMLKGIAVTEYLDRAAYFVSRGLALCGILAIAALLILVAGDVFFRYFLNAPLLFAEEVSGYLVALIGYFGAAETLRCNRHIRVEVLVKWLPSRAQLWLNAAAHVVGTLILAVFAWHVVVFVERSFSRGTVSASILAVPLWVPQTAMLLGTLAFLLQIILETMRAVRAISGPVALGEQA